MIQVTQLSLTYPCCHALQDVDLHIPQGQITALVGPSGCGKSSMLLCINRLIDLVPGAVVQGSICVDGQEVLHSKQAAPMLRRKVGMIFQKPNPFPMSIRQNLQLALREFNLGDKKWREDRMRRALEDVGLWSEVAGRLDTPAEQLSGGQQQRLCFARALLLEPEVLLLDEPCSALDPLAAEVVEQLVLRLRGAYTIAMVTHNLSQARRLADHLAVFWHRAGAGTVIAAGPAASMFTDPGDQVAADYLSGQRG
jgi:phosphate transport system ATP-binding protein